MPLQQQVAQFVMPVPHDLGDVGLDPCKVEPEVRTGPPPDHQVHPRQRGFRDLDGRVHALPVKGPLQHLLDALPDFLVEAIARQENHHRVEASIAVMAGENADPLPLRQAENAKRYFGQLLSTALKELISRQGLEHMAQCLPVMAVPREP
jgi:hypothetical protein